MNRARFPPALVQFLFSRCVFLVSGAFIWLLIFCHQQTWGKSCVSSFRIVFPCLILLGESCLAFGEFSSLRTHSGGYWVRVLCAVVAHVKKKFTMTFLSYTIF